MLTFAQKSSIRRHLDYPVVGLLKTSPAGGTLGSPFAGYRFFQTYGRLEFKMNNLNPDEEARITGDAYGAIAFVGPNPTPGDQIGITISGGGLATPQVVTATMPNFDPTTSGLAIFGNTLVAALLSNSAIRDAGFQVVSPFGTGPFNENELPLVEIAITNAVAFSLSSPTATGVVWPQITANGALLGPSSSVDGINTYNGFLNILDALESAWPATSQNLDTMKAGPWQARATEAAARASLYQNWQVRLSRFLDIPIFTGRDSQRSEYVGPSRMM